MSFLVLEKLALNMIPHDYHIHSNFSCDCRYAMAEMSHGALTRGIPEIGFTEHYDLHPGEPRRDWFRLESWAGELERCRAVFDGKLIIRAGIEIGEPHIYRAETQALLQRYPFDYVLGSLHWVGPESIFERSYFRRPAAEAFRLFFEELERMTRAGGFDVLSHFDVPVRTAFDVYGEYDPRRYAEAIRPVLKNCIQHGIALDVNTKGLRSSCKMLTPGLDILRWYAELGGERVTLGSDAHVPKYVGADLDLALAAIQRAGLKYVTHFEKRQARLSRIA
ncbi:MAG TPA: histidinol-phosphatase HisJ family protein [Anaerolineae bacterium]|nr:histidinol-phosphatase HisJ family protein [Anaerolineae bacterium]